MISTAMLLSHTHSFSFEFTKYAVGCGEFAFAHTLHMNNVEHIFPLNSICFFCFLLLFFISFHLREANLNSLHFVFSIDFADSLAFVLRSPFVHSFSVYILMFLFLLLLLFVGRAQHVKHTA